MSANKEYKRTNPFFEKWDNTYEIPPFNQIMVEDYREAFLKGMEEQNREVEAITNNQEIPTFDNTVVAIDASGSLLNKTSAIFFAESSANGTNDILQLESEIIPLLTQHSNKIMMNKALFEKLKYVKEHTDFSSMTPEDIMLIYELYTDFVHNGVNLSDTEMRELQKINEELSKAENRFAQNLLNETGSYQLIIDNEKDLSGLSETVISSAANRAKKIGQRDKWIFGLDNPSIMPFLTSAHNKELRAKLLNAYLNRCNNNNDYDNKIILKNIVVLRDKKAKLLGYDNFAEYILARRMAKNSSNVYNLLDKIWLPGLNKAKKTLKEMQILAGQRNNIRASDWRYYAEKLKSMTYDLSDESLRPYFQIENVVNGLFWVANQLYGIIFRESTELSKPNKDVRTFVCIDNDDQTELGVLFIDLYARPGLKTVGAWCGTYRDTYQNREGKRVKPLTYVCCNFTAPVNDQPSLVTPDDAETFFHEMGHALNNLFKNVKYHSTGDVPCDFAEIPSQFMEHWVFKPQVLVNYARHYQTDEIIPQTIIDKIQSASNYGQEFATIEYIAAAYLDMDYHVSPSPECIDVLEFETCTLNARGLISQIPPRYRSTYFKHAFENSYAAGYYSYIWSEIFSCDAFEAFTESGDIFNKELAAKFRHNILEPGGSSSVDALYLNFRGRQPDVNALLRNRGLNL